MKCCKKIVWNVPRNNDLKNNSVKKLLVAYTLREH